jgi:hypothetical protein
MRGVGPFEMIRAGTTEEVHRDSGEWIFVDIGFAKAARSCGVLIGVGAPKLLTFGETRRELAELVGGSGEPINLLLEAPLSVAFTQRGNPTGRRVEKRGAQVRYWYVGLGTTVLLAAAYLLREMANANRKREVRLFEGFVSFKEKGVASSHAEDVIKLRAAVYAELDSAHRIFGPADLAMSPGDRIESAFTFAGMEFGIPPVIAVGAGQHVPPDVPASGPSALRQGRG